MGEIRCDVDRCGGGELVDRRAGVLALGGLDPGEAVDGPDELADRRLHAVRRGGGGDAGRGGAVFAPCDAGSFDGIRLDDTGRVWAAAHDGVHCFDPDGTLLGKLHIPEIVSNLTFGGAQRNHLFITATSSLYSLRVNFTGAPAR